MIQAYSINGRLCAKGIKKDSIESVAVIFGSLYTYKENKSPDKFVHLNCNCMHHQFCLEAPTAGGIIRDNN